MLIIFFEGWLISSAPDKIVSEVGDDVEITLEENWWTKIKKIAKTTIEIEKKNE